MRYSTCLADSAMRGSNSAGYKLPDGLWEQGKETTYTLGINTAGKKLFEIGNSSIDEWGSGGSYEGDLAPGIDIGTEI